MGKSSNGNADAGSKQKSIIASHATMLGSCCLGTLRPKINPRRASARGQGEETKPPPTTPDSRASRSNSDVGSSPVAHATHHGGELRAVLVQHAQALHIIGVPHAHGIVQAAAEHKSFVLVVLLRVMGGDVLDGEHGALVAVLHHVVRYVAPEAPPLHRVPQHDARLQTNRRAVNGVRELPFVSRRVRF